MIEFGECVQAALRHRSEREGLQLHVASYGGSGTTFTVEFLHQQRRTLTPLWHQLLNHYAVPLDLGVPRLVLLADPPTAHASLVRRSNIRGVTRHLHGGQYGQECVAGMVAFFDRWTAAPPAIGGDGTLQPVVICKYEALHANLEKIATAIGVHFRRFPKPRPRKSVPAETIDPRLLALRERFCALPDLVVRS